MRCLLGTGLKERLSAREKDHRLHHQRHHHLERLGSCDAYCEQDANRCQREREKQQRGQHSDHASDRQVDTDERREHKKDDALCDRYRGAAAQWTT